MPLSTEKQTFSGVEGNLIINQGFGEYKSEIN